jgi:uncharacterized membrane protein YfcA
MAKWIGWLSMAVGTAGIFLGFYYLGDSPQKSLEIMTISSVGIVGVLAFLRHVVFHKSDAARLGWVTERPDWMFEVGFANLAFGIVGFVVVLAPLGIHAQAAILLAYAIYLLQAGLWHGYRYFTDPVKSPARLWRSCLSTLLFAGMMSFFALHALCM